MEREDEEDRGEIEKYREEDVDVEERAWEDGWVEDWKEEVSRNR